jgi:hypothetical protein
MKDLLALKGAQKELTHEGPLLPLIKFAYLLHNLIGQAWLFGWFQMHKISLSVCLSLTFSLSHTHISRDAHSSKWDMARKCLRYIALPLDDAIHMAHGAHGVFDSAKM